jgi:hypothetical protein
MSSVLCLTSYYVKCFMPSFILCQVFYAKLHIMSSVLCQASYYVKCFMLSFILCQVFYAKLHIMSSVLCQASYYVRCFMPSFILCQVLYAKLHIMLGVLFQVSSCIVYTYFIWSMIQRGSDTSLTNLWSLLPYIQLLLHYVENAQENK